MEADKKLKEALDEALTEEIKNIPSDKEIKQMHTFSGSFRLSIKRLLMKEEEEKKKSRTYFHIILKTAACMVLLAGVGTLVFLNAPFLKRDDSANDAAQNGTGMESASAPQDTAAEESTAEESTTEESVPDTGMGEDDKMDADGRAELLTNEFWRIKSISFDETYRLEFVIENPTRQEITYGEVYQCSYELNGKTVVSDFMADEAFMKLEPGKTAVESLKLDTEIIPEAGGVLTLTRLINEEEVEISVSVE